MSIEMKCVNCEQPFYCYPHEAEKGRKYCSLMCRTAHLHKKGLSAASRTPVEFTCKECAKPFTMMQSYVKAYEKKFKRQPLYCSMDCSNTGRRKDADERHKLTCAHCGKTEVRTRNRAKFRIYKEQKYCSVECKSAAQETRAFDRFNAGNFGRHVKRNGYVWISVPALANGGKKGSVMEHRYVMAKHLGRSLLSEETVHHIDGNRANNDIRNLELFSSRHGPGQRVTDKVAWAIEILTLYPDFLTQLDVDALQRVVQQKNPLPPKPTNFVESLKSKLVDNGV